MVRPPVLPVGLLLCLGVGRADAFATTAGPSPPSRRSSALAAASPRRDDGARLHRRRDFVARSIAAAAGGVASVAIPPAVGPALANDDDGSAAAAAAPTDDAPIDPSVGVPKITQKVYLDVKFAKYKEPKRLVIGLFGDVMPRTVENFVALSTGDELSYKGATFYRVISELTIQGGAIGNNSGKSGTSSFEGGKPFPPDNYRITHMKEGLVSAVRTVGGDVDSRFFVQTEADAGWADGRYAAFGIVLEEEGTGGMDLVRRISRAEVKAPQNSPVDPITIVGCGIFGG